MILIKKTRRALSTIVTSAILLSAVAIMGAAVVAWSNSNLSAHQQELEETFTASINKIKENLVFENVWFKSTLPKSVNVTLSNIGDVGLNVTNIKFVDPTDTTTILSRTISNGGIVRDSEYSTVIEYDWTSNDEFNIVVTTGRDSIFSTQVLPP